MASTASAQSVLERVLGQIDNSTNLASVNGTFANIAENIGGAGVVETNLYANSGTVLTQSEFDALVADNTVTNTFVAGDGIGTNPTDDTYYNLATNSVISEAAHGALSTAEQLQYTVVTGTEHLTQSASGKLTLNTDNTTRDTLVTTGNALIATVLATKEVVTVGSIGEGINGSISNTIDGIDAQTQTAIAGTVSAIEYNMPTFDFGDMATTALGAVNTGDITLGVNSSIDNAKTTSTEAVSSVMNQLGGSADTGAIVLNIASNMTGVNGSINNAMMEVNGSIGNLSTTALGAVNTGIIISGVNAAVTGITGASAGQ